MSGQELSNWAMNLASSKSSPDYFPSKKIGYHYFIPLHIIENAIFVSPIISFEVRSSSKHVTWSSSIREDIGISIVWFQVGVFPPF